MNTAYVHYNNTTLRVTKLEINTGHGIDSDRDEDEDDFM